MKFQRKNEKKSASRLRVALILLLFIGVVGLFEIFKNINIKNFNFLKLLPFTFGKLVSPVPSHDPIPELTNKLSEKNIPVDFPLVATDSAILARLVEGPEVLFSLNNDFALQVDSLQIILSRLKIEGKKVKRIDFRYERPVVVYWE